MERKYLPALFNKSRNDQLFSFPHLVGNLADRGSRNPVIDLQENDDELILSADISEFDPRDLDITVNNNVVILKGNCQREEIQDKPGYYFATRSWHSFYQTIPLPARVKSEKTMARFENGVLELKMIKGKTLAKNFKPQIMFTDQPS